MTSAAYARSSEPVPGNESDGKFLSHYPVKRLPAEVLLDAIARVTEVPSNFPGYPAGWRSLQLPDTKVESTFLASFGRPERLNTCSCERSAEPSMSQALHLANGATVNEKLRDPKGAVAPILAAKVSDAEVVADRLCSSPRPDPPPRPTPRAIALSRPSSPAAAPPATRRQSRRRPPAPGGRRPVLGGADG